MSRKQKSVAISTAETEYIATSMISCEAAWLQKLLSELFVHMMNTTVILCDNQRWDNVQVADILSKPWGKVKSVTFPSDLELLRDLLIRVLHVACIELWELWGGLGYLLEQHATTGRLTLPWWCAMNRMISSPVGRDD